MKKFSDIKTVPGYEHLEHVLVSAYLQAAVGKGAERHADDKPFTEQPMQTIAQSLGSVDGMLFQVNKKLGESRGLPDGRRQAEVLGAIVYSAGVHIAYDTWFSNAQVAGMEEPKGCKEQLLVDAEDFEEQLLVDMIEHLQSGGVRGPALVLDDTRWAVLHRLGVKKGYWSVGALASEVMYDAMQIKLVPNRPDGVVVAYIERATLPVVDVPVCRPDDKDDEGWIVGKWYDRPVNQPPPMPIGYEFQVRRRSKGETDWLPVTHAGVFRWQHDDISGDVVAYRTRVKDPQKLRIIMKFDGDMYAVSEWIKTPDGEEPALPDGYEFQFKLAGRLSSWWSAAEVSSINWPIVAEYRLRNRV